MVFTWLQGAGFELKPVVFLCCHNGSIVFFYGALYTLHTISMKPPVFLCRYRHAVFELDLFVTVILCTDADKLLLSCYIEPDQPFLFFPAAFVRSQWHYPAYYQIMHSHPYLP